MKRQLSFIGIAALVVSLSGCPFKKHQPPVPQQGQAPTVPPEPVPPPVVETPPEPQPVPPPPETSPEKAEDKAPKKKPSPKKPATPATANQPANPPAPAPAQAPAKTSKLIIQEGNSPNSQGQLAAGVGLSDSSARAKQTTEQLLQAAQGNLNGINRPLSPEEQAMVAQIKDYMTQARKATDDSDTVRAHNLALKAYLLSDELVKK